MKIPLFYVDAFTSEVFKGNTAGVCLLESWLPEEVLQSIAQEHNLSETAFVVKNNDYFQIKWFTPKNEVDLCGHATLGAAHVLFKIYNFGSKPIKFQSKSGILTASQSTDGKITLDFPSMTYKPFDKRKEITEALGKEPSELYISTKVLAVFKNEKDIISLSPNFEKMRTFDFMGIIATAPGEKCDYVLRFFAPKVGINEDPVTGSAQTVLIPYWTKRLKKQKMFSKQLSERIGEIWTELKDERVLLTGDAIIYMQGTIQITIKQQNTLVPFSFEEKKQ
jgi:PhzF family phenazine biosynthesis protein